MNRFALGFAAMISLGLLAMAGGCQSTKEPGVTSSYRSQWTTVSAEPRVTTEAARAVLEEQGLKDIRADSTNVDGTARGKKADGTEVKVSIRKKGEASSEVTTTVGTVGDPSLGAEITRRIAERAQGMGSTVRPAGSR